VDKPADSSLTGLVQGLQQHLEATHDLFVYGFSRDHPDVVPTVNVHIAPDVYNSHGEFVQLDIDAYHMPANKVNGFALPASFGVPLQDCLQGKLKGPR
jgi:hypothetical protein